MVVRWKGKKRGGVILGGIPSLKKILPVDRRRVDNRPGMWNPSL
jgi:hypothetical protein